MKVFNIQNPVRKQSKVHIFAPGFYVFRAGMHSEKFYNSFFCKKMLHFNDFFFTNNFSTFDHMEKNTPISLHRHNFYLPLFESLQFFKKSTKFPTVQKILADEGRKKTFVCLKKYVIF